MTVPSLQDLEQRVADARGDDPDSVRRRVDALNALAWALCDTDLERARALAVTAAELSVPPHCGDTDYATGIALSLRTQGYLDQRSGDHALGLTRLYEAQPLCVALGHQDALADVYDGISGTFLQMGDFENALQSIQQHLEVARAIGDAARAANANNNLGALYFEAGDYTGARDVFERNLQYALASGDERIAFLSHANLSETRLRLGELPAAIESARSALAVSRRAGYPLFEVYAIVMLGQLLLAEGDARGAVEALGDALSLSRALGARPSEVGALMYLGEAYSAMGEHDRALAHAREAEAVARALESKSERMRAELALAHVLEASGDCESALAHHRAYSALREEIVGERTEQRLQVLRVVHETETARRSAVVEERARLARELHDSVTQTLFSLTLLSRAGNEAAADGDAARLAECLADLESGSLRALRQMRGLLFELRPAALQQGGLLEAVEARLNAVERRSGLRLDVSLGEMPRLPAELEAELYRVIVEGLNNVQKHAEASSLVLHLAQTETAIRLRIADDGRGFDPSPDEGGMGLTIIRERVARMGGSVSISSDPGRGTSVEASVPIPLEVLP